MKLLKEIYDSDFGLNNEDPNRQYKFRQASRAILFNNEGKIAILYVSRNDYPKLPGGGIKKGESIEQTLDREILEETGCKISVSKEIGIILEKREKFELIQISYCFIGKVIGDIGIPSFTQKEINNGFKLTWKNIDEAIKELKACKTDNYQGMFIKTRDLTFLEEANRIYN